MNFSYLNGTNLNRLEIMVGFKTVKLTVKWIQSNFEIRRPPNVCKKSYFSYISRFFKTIKILLVLTHGNDSFGDIIELFTTNITHKAVYICQKH